MKKLFFNILIGIGAFLVSYTLGKMVGHNNFPLNEAILYIIPGIIVSLIGYWGYKKNYNQDTWLRT